MNVPSPWATVLLALAAFRIFRFLGYDTILDRPRDRLLRKAKANAGAYRRELDVFFHCPWCLGFWCSGAVLGAYCAVFGWFGWFGFFVVWFAISAAVGLVTKNLDP